MLVVKESLCSQSNEGFRKQKWSQSYFFIIIIVSREVWVASIFIGVWFPASRSVDSSHLWKERCSPGGFITGSAAEVSHFIMADFSFSFQKVDNTPVAGASLANTAQLFLELYCVSALLCESLGRQARTTGDQPETEQCFTHSSINRLPCSLQTPCLLHSHQYLPRKRKQAPFAKKELDRRKKTTPVLPAPKSHPVFNEENTFHLFLAVSARGCELRVQFYFWLISKSKTHRWGEKWLHVFTAVDSVMSLAEMRCDFSPVLSVTNDSFHEGAVEPFAVLLDTCCVIYIPRESDESSSRPPFHFLLCCHVKPTDIDAEKCGQRNVSVKKELWFLFSSPVLHRQLWGDGKDLIGPRSQCQRAGQRAVDAAARRRHLWPCRIGHNPYCIVSRQKGTSHGYQTLVYQLPAS